MSMCGIADAVLDSVNTPGCRRMFAELCSRVEAAPEAVDVSTAAAVLWACNVAQLLPQRLLETCGFRSLVSRLSALKLCKVSDVALSVVRPSMWRSCCRSAGSRRARTATCLLPQAHSVCVDRFV